MYADMDGITPRRRRDTRTPCEVGLRLTQRQRRILGLLDPHLGFKYLTSRWLHTFVGGNEDAFKRTLRRLFDAGYLDRPIQQRATPNANYKHIVYAQTAKAAALLDAPDLATHRSGSFAHELLVDLGVYAPLRFAVAQDQALVLFDARQLLDGAEFRLRTNSVEHTAFARIQKFGDQEHFETLTVPVSTRTSADPFRITLRNGDTMRFDGTPFVLQRRMPDASTSSIFVPGVEVDRGTENLGNVAAKDRFRTTLTGHLDQIIAWFRERGFRDHYGMRMMMVPIITTSERRMQSAMKYVQDAVGPCRYLLFKTARDLVSLEHFPEPSADMFVSPWNRVGFEPFAFDVRGFQ